MKVTRMKVKIDFKCDMLKKINDNWLYRLKKIQNKQGYINVNEKDSLRYRELDTGIGFCLMKDWCIKVE